MKGNGPSGKKSGFGKTNKRSRRAHDHSRASRISYNSQRCDLTNKKRKLRRHVAAQPNDAIALTALDKMAANAPRSR